jgi:hypothetical protein
MTAVSGVRLNPTPLPVRFQLGCGLINCEVAQGHKGRLEWGCQGQPVRLAPQVKQAVKGRKGRRVKPRLAFFRINSVSLPSA